MEDPLDNLENMANAAGETPHADANENKQVQANDNDIAPEPETVPVVRKSAMDIALLNKIESEQIHILRAAVARGLDKDDPVIDIYNAASSAARSANSVATAAVEVLDWVNAIPNIVQDAVIKGAGDIRGEVKQAFLANVDSLGNAIREGTNTGVNESIKRINFVIGQLLKATKGVDDEMNKQIIAKRDAVLSQWVQSGSDELNKRISEAVKKERNISLGFLTFTMSAVFIFGVVVGMHLHF